MISPHVRDMDVYELRHFYAMIQRDFARGEYQPFSVLSDQLARGVQQGLVLQDGERQLAYAIVSGCLANNSLLVSLLAVMPGQRGNGVGSFFLKAIAQKYAGRDAIILEVERPKDAKTPQEAQRRKKRIAFYQKAGFHVVPGIGFYSIWGVPMHLMALPLQADARQIDNNIDKTISELYAPLLEEHMEQLKIHMAARA